MVLMNLKAGGGEQGSTQLEKKLQSDLSFLQPAFAHLCASQDDTNRKSIACSTLEVIHIFSYFCCLCMHYYNSNIIFHIRGCFFGMCNCVPSYTVKQCTLFSIETSAYKMSFGVYFDMDKLQIFIESLSALTCRGVSNWLHLTVQRILFRIRIYQCSYLNLDLRFHELILKAHLNRSVHVIHWFIKLTKFLKSSVLVCELFTHSIIVPICS